MLQKKLHKIKKKKKYIGSINRHTFDLRATIFLLHITSKCEVDYYLP